MTPFGHLLIITVDPDTEITAPDGSVFLITNDSSCIIKDIVYMTHTACKRFKEKADQIRQMVDARRKL